MRLSRKAEELLKILMWWRRKRGRADPLQSKLADMLGVTMRQVRRYLRELAALVTIRKCGPNAAEYDISAQAEQQLAAQNVRSTSGQCPVNVQSGPYSLSSSSSPSTNMRAERKPPRMANAAQRRADWLVARAEAMDQAEARAMAVGA